MNLDAYVWRARIAPALVVVGPLLAVVAASAVTQSALAVGGGAGAAALLFLTGELVRDAGKRIEPEMWSSWGGPPTTRRLRHADNVDGVGRLHGRMTEATGMPLPDADEEAGDPEGADRRYAEATATLRARTRDRSQFGLLFAENVSYGFRRNLFALRLVGVLIAVGVLVGCGVALLVGAGSLAGIALPMLCSACLLVVYLRVIDEGWVKAAAEAYAERLLESTARVTKA